MSARSTRISAPAATTRSAQPRDTLLALIGYVLWRQRRRTVIWGALLGLLSAVTVLLYPSLGGQEQLNQIIEQYPPEVRELFGIGQGTDLSTIEGWLASQVFSFMAPLALAFFPILAGAGAIAGAEERGTLDVLLSNPVPRWQVIAANFIATAISLLGVIAILWAMTWVPTLLVDVDLPWTTAVAGSLNLWPLSLLFGGLAMLLSAALRSRGLAIGICGIVLIGMYFLDALGAAADALEPFQPLSVFYHYGSGVENGIEWLSFAVIALLGIGLAALAVPLFNRRDIYA